MTWRMQELAKLDKSTLLARASEIEELANRLQEKGNPFISEVPDDVRAWILYQGMLRSLQLLMGQP